MENTETIKRLNDNFRRNLFQAKPHNHLMLTAQVSALSHDYLMELLTQVRDFEDFNESNDPYGEHDFGKINFRGENYFFKIDYYDENMEFHAEDPANENTTERVLTIMHVDEY